jgi:aldose 1-epimerase
VAPSNSRQSPAISEEPLGEVDGQVVKRYTLSNTLGLEVQILSYGGIIQSLALPDRNGNLANVVLGFSVLDDYLAYNPAPTAMKPQGAGTYFGALIGRYANRIADGEFALDDNQYSVPANDGRNSLHGGDIGFDQKVWAASGFQSDGVVGVRLEYVSRAGEMGFPGTLTTVATYSLDGANRLALLFEATTDAPTVLNLTNHTYWNLAGEGSGTIYDHLLSVNADHYTPLTDMFVPTGQVLPVAGTAFDFRQPMVIGERIRADDAQLAIGHGYDHNWAVNQTRPRSLVLAATASDPGSGRCLRVYTTQPGIQFYSGNFLDGRVRGRSGRAYRQSDGFALETQHFPGSPNHPAFPSTVLRPGEKYEETTVFELSCPSS